jgi:membrane-associated protein
MTLAGVETWIGHWGYVAVFLVVVLGNIGLPVPEETIILLSGYLAWRGTFSLPAAIAVGILSAIAGDNLGYWVGRRAGRPLLESYGRYLWVSPQTIRKAEDFFARYGHWAVFLGRFIAGVRFLNGPLAGISRMPFREFFPYNAGGAVVYVTAVALVGYAAGENLHSVLRLLERAEHFIALAVAILVIGLGYRFLRRSRS